MPRKRLDLKLIENESTRKVTFRKRKEGLTKKMEEITTLCGIDGCLVIVNPQEDEPYVWPSREKAMELFEKYESMPKVEQDKNKLDHVMFMTSRVEKLKEQIARQEKKNNEMRASQIMYQMSKGKKMAELNIDEVELLLWYSDMKLRELNRRNLLLPPIKPPPPAPAPAQLANQNQGDDMKVELSYPVENDPPFMEMLACEGGPVGANGKWKGANQNQGDDMTEELSYLVENDPLFRAMFTYERGPLGANWISKGEPSNGNQHNNSDVLYGPQDGCSGSFPGQFL